MALTLLRIPKTETEPAHNLLFRSTLSPVKMEETDEIVDKLFIKVSIVDENLQTLSEPVISEILIPEEEFHTTLRKESSERGQYITSHSTDPDWNPEGYSKNLKDVN